VGVATSPALNFVGSNLTYTITVTNGGPVAAPNVRFSDSLPWGSTLISVTSSMPSALLVTNTSPITGSLPLLSMGETWTLEIKVRAAGTGYATNHISLSSDWLDPAPGNNSVTTINNILPLPILAIQLVTNYARISWPLALSNFTLEAKTGLAATNYWSNVVSSVAQTTNANVVTQAVSTPLRVYRLKN